LSAENAGALIVVTVAVVTGVPILLLALSSFGSIS
jgi:hypothetical protein